MRATARLQVLVADGDPESNAATCSFLHDEGFRSTPALDASELANSLREVRPQILLLSLPPDPRAAERRLATVRSYDRDLCIIAMAREPNVESAVAAMKYQVFEYLSHPWCEETLRKALDAAVEEKGLLVSLEQRLNREIGSSVRTRRVENGLTLRQVATRTGLSISLISQIELGKSAASVSTLFKLSRALHVKVGHFCEAV